MSAPSAGAPDPRNGLPFANLIPHIEIDDLNLTPAQSRRLERAGRDENNAEEIANEVLSQILDDVDVEVPLGMAVRVLQFGKDEPGRLPHELYGIAVSLDHSSKAHREFLAALQERAPHWVRVMNEPPSPPRRPQRDIDL